MAAETEAERWATWLEAGEKEKLAGREENEHAMTMKESGNSRARPCRFG